MLFFRLLCRVPHRWALLTVAEPHHLVHTEILQSRWPLLELNFRPVFCWCLNKPRATMLQRFVVLLCKVAVLQLNGSRALCTYQDSAPAHSCIWPWRNRGSTSSESQAEWDKMPQRGARNQVFSFQTTSAHVETCGIQEKCPREMRVSQTAAPC